MQDARHGNTSVDVTVDGHGFDEYGHRYLKLHVVGSNRSLPPYSMDDLLDQKKLYRDLSDAGCNLFSKQAQSGLQRLLQGHKYRNPTFSVVTRLGSFGKYYVRPTDIIGKPILPVELVLAGLDQGMLEKYRCRRKLESWQKTVGKLCQGNTRLMFAASLACTGPILSFVDGPRTGGFQISGKAESGKTTAAMVAGSIWGCHRESARAEKGFAESWNTTEAELEQTARAHCDSILILDDTNLAGATEKQRARVVLNGSFRLSENMKKKRYNEPASPAWRLYFLSTSNLTVDELAEQAGIFIDDQHRGRLVDIALPRGPHAYGVYEELHGFDDGASLTDALKKRCRTRFGTPGHELVRRIYEDKSAREHAKAFVAERREHYIARIKRKAASRSLKPLERSVARFATVYAAGALAIEYNIFSWKRNDLLRAVLSCQLDSIHRSTEAPSVSPRMKLLDYFEEHRGYFLDLNSSKLDPTMKTLTAMPGFTHTHKGIDWLYWCQNSSRQ